jgi:1-aminocyclopropane-1-carboxylate deaminase/D-cysteine desulfhydrase-like pyridoxal-dependent ACC family enzyme
MNKLIQDIQYVPEILVQSMSDEVCSKFGVKLDVMRLDQVDADLSGNKWFKLKYNIQRAYKLKYSRLLSFGGYYSNHLHALAAAGHRFGFETIGVVRGVEPTIYGPTLSDLLEYGMQLKFVSRESYRNKACTQFISDLGKEFADVFIIPEGGSNVLGVKGCTEIVSHLWDDLSLAPDYIVMGCGTGATLAGVILGTKNRCQIIGVSALKGAQYLEQNVLSLITEYGKYEEVEPIVSSDMWQIQHGYHFGGFARLTPELVNFMDEFTADVGLPLEPVYVGKSLYAIQDLVRRAVIPLGARVLLIHTGGLQGLRGMAMLMQKQRNRVVQGSS